VNEFIGIDAAGRVRLLPSQRIANFSNGQKDGWDRDQYAITLETLEYFSHGDVGTKGGKKRRK